MAGQRSSHANIYIYIPLYKRKLGIFPLVACNTVLGEPDVIYLPTNHYCSSVYIIIDCDNTVG